MSANIHDDIIADPNSSWVLSDEERFPLMTQSGKDLLKRLREHPNAPAYNHRCGDRLKRDGLERVRAFELELRTAKKGWKPGEIPAWVVPFAQRCLEKVPIYRKSGASADHFLSIPTVSRADIGREPWSFVPDGQSLDDLIFYGTTGTSGHPVKIPSHPEVSSKYLALLRAALSMHDVKLEGGSGHVAIVLVCAQNYTYTYASVSSFLDEGGFLKVNLNPHEWRQPTDRARFLDDLNAEIYTGDPISLFELAKLQLKTRPKAIVSTAMTLLPGWKRELESIFGCPIIDLYSSNECRLIAASVYGGHLIVAHDVFVEILDERGAQCPPGVRGEITLTCPRNQFLPLLRYRTGDSASMQFTSGAPLLVGIEGRPPTLFVASDGKILNNIDVSVILYSFPIAQFTLHQNADRSIVFKMRGDADEKQVHAMLTKVFGSGQKITMASLTDADTVEGKVIQYTSDFRNLDPYRNEKAYQRLTLQQILHPRM